MKKIGLCVCYDTKNYGSQLQVLATQIKVKENGCDYEIIRYKKRKSIKFMLKSLPRLCNPYLVKSKMRGIRKKQGLKKYPEYLKQNSIRNKRFDGFIDSYFDKLSPVYGDYTELRNCTDKYDAFLVGSDQLWLPSGLASGFYTLGFVPDNKPKIAYATSFGVSQIPWYQTTRTKAYLNRFNALSTREKQGGNIIKNLTGKEANVVCDPTLLLTASEWDNVIPQKKVVDEKYVFCYFLGENPEHRKIANELKEKTGLTLITTPFLDDFVEIDTDFGDKKLFDVGADDFVNLIRNAEYVLTDSFHGSVFSILNHKKFVTLNRFVEGAKDSRNSRIDSLCDLLGLEDRRYKGDVYNNITKDVDYNAVDERLANLRKDSLYYLKKALEI